MTPTIISIGHSRCIDPFSHLDSKGQQVVDRVGGTISTRCSRAPEVFYLKFFNKTTYETWQHDYTHIKEAKDSSTTFLKFQVSLSLKEK